MIMQILWRNWKENWFKEVIAIAFSDHKYYFTHINLRIYLHHANLLIASFFFSKGKRAGGGNQTWRPALGRDHRAFQTRIEFAEENRNSKVSTASPGANALSKGRSEESKDPSVTAQDSRGRRYHVSNPWTTDPNKDMLTTNPPLVTHSWMRLEE